VDHELHPEASVADYQFRFGNAFAKGMVLQMGPKRAQIWGHGRPFSEVVLSMMDDQLKLTSSVNRAIFLLIYFPTKCLMNTN
jgi:hypothetical protein